MRALAALSFVVLAACGGSGGGDAGGGGGGGDDTPFGGGNILPHPVVVMATAWPVGDFVLYDDGAVRLVAGE